MNLYEITTEMQSILDAMLDGGVDSPEAMNALTEHLSGLDSVLESKADAYAGIIAELTARADARTKEAQRIRTLATADQALADRLKERLKEAMERTGKTRLETARFRMAVAGNGGKQPMIVNVDPLDLPPELIFTTVSPDKDAIRAVLEAGGTVEGCALLPRGTSLRIK